MSPSMTSEIEQLESNVESDDALLENNSPSQNIPHK